MATKGTKRVDAVDSRAASVLVRAKDGSAFARWLVIVDFNGFTYFHNVQYLNFNYCYLYDLFESFSAECKKDVPVALIDMHSCSLEAKIKMNLGIIVIHFFFTYHIHNYIIFLIEN